MVWRATREIPYGRRRSYGDVANAIGRPKAARAVGGALGKNPYVIVVPCHRVVGASGALTGVRLRRGMEGRPACAGGKWRNRERAGMAVIMDIEAGEQRLTAEWAGCAAWVHGLRAPGAGPGRKHRIGIRPGPGQVRHRAGGAGCKHARRRVAGGRVGVVTIAGRPRSGSVQRVAQSDRGPDVSSVYAGGGRHRKRSHRAYEVA